LGYFGGTNVGNITTVELKISHPIHPFGWKVLSFLSKPALAEKQQSKHGVENQSQQPDLLKRLAAWLVSDRSFDDLLVKHQQRKTLSTAAMRVIRRFVPHRNPEEVFIHILAAIDGKHHG
jgi:hypothetical protein